MQTTFIMRLRGVATKMADDLKVLTDNMEGKGVSPAEAPLKISKLREIEQKLRMIGANEADPIPFRD